MNRSAFRSLRDKLYNGLNSGLEGVKLNGHREKRLAGNLNLSFEYVDADSLMMSMREIAVSSGSACSSAEAEPSHVLKAIGVRNDLIKSSIRFGIGRFNTGDEINYTINRVIEKVNELRKLSPAFKLTGAFKGKKLKEQIS